MIIISKAREVLGLDLFLDELKQKIQEQETSLISLHEVNSKLESYKEYLEWKNDRLKEEIAEEETEKQNAKDPSELPEDVRDYMTEVVNKYCNITPEILKDLQDLSPPEFLDSAYSKVSDWLYFSNDKSKEDVYEDVYINFKRYYYLYNKPKLEKKIKAKEIEIASNLIIIELISNEIPKRSSAKNQTYERGLLIKYYQQYITREQDPEKKTEYMLKLKETIREHIKQIDERIQNLSEIKEGDIGQEVGLKIQRAIALYKQIPLSDNKEELKENVKSSVASTLSTAESIVKTPITIINKTFQSDSKLKATIAAIPKNINRRLSRIINYESPFAGKSINNVSTVFAQIINKLKKECSSEKVM